ncbi:MAG: hypothetical protein ACR2QA_01255 [Solirubrobacteraceae bacterium]
MTTRASSSRVLLVPDRRIVSSESAGSPVRRYRLARLHLDDRAADPASRFDHLKRVYD